MGLIQDEAEHHLREAWRLLAGKADRYTARTLFLRAALPATRREVPALYLGLLKTLLDQGIQPMPSRNTAVQNYLEQNLSAAQFTLFDAMYAAINEPAGLTRLSALPGWQAFSTATAGRGLAVKERVAPTPTNETEPRL